MFGRGKVGIERVYLDKSGDFSVMDYIQSEGLEGWAYMGSYYGQGEEDSLVKEAVRLGARGVKLVSGSSDNEKYVFVRWN